MSSHNAILFLATTLIFFSPFAQSAAGTTLGPWQVDTPHNAQGNYVHSRLVTLADTQCQQTRIGQVNRELQNKTPSHVLWDHDCALPVEVIRMANASVSEHLTPLDLLSSEAIHDEANE